MMTLLTVLHLQVKHVGDSVHLETRLHGLGEKEATGFFQAITGFLDGDKHLESGTVEFLHAGQVKDQLRFILYQRKDFIEKGFQGKDGYFFGELDFHQDHLLGFKIKTG